MNLLNFLKIKVLMCYNIQIAVRYYLLNTIKSDFINTLYTAYFIILMNLCILC